MRETPGVGRSGPHGLALDVAIEAAVVKKVRSHDSSKSNLFVIILFF